MMTSTIWTTDLLNETRRSARVRHFRYWLSILGLAFADGLCFLLADLLFRAGASVPTIVLFVGRTPHAPTTPLNVFALLGAAFILIRYISGDYSRRQLFFDGAKGTTIALLITAIPDLLMYALGSGLYSLSPILLSWLFLLIFLPILRQGARMLMTRLDIWQIPTAMIGINRRTAEICTALKQSLSLGFDVRWLVIEDPDTRAPQSMAAIRPIHSSDPARIAQIIGSAGCKEAIVAAEDMQSAHFAEVVQRLLEVNIPVAIIPSINRLPLAGVTTNYFFGRDILMLQVRSNVQRLPSRIVKRFFDIVFSAFLLVVLSPLFLIIAIAIKRADPGKVTYSHRRVGRDGVPFDCLKFRTMVTDADARLKRWREENPDLYEEYCRTFKLRDDPRQIEVLGDGQQRKSYLYVQDCIDAMLLAIDKANESVNLFNLGTEEFCRVDDSLGWICSHLDLNPRRCYSGGERGWIGDSPFIFLDTAKIRALGWKPKLTIREAVLRTLQYLQANPRVLEQRREAA